METTGGHKQGSLDPGIGFFQRGPIDLDDLWVELVKKSRKEKTAGKKRIIHSFSL